MAERHDPSDPDATRRVSRADLVRAIEHARRARERAADGILLARDALTRSRLNRELWLEVRRERDAHGTTKPKSASQCHGST